MQALKRNDDSLICVNVFHLIFYYIRFNYVYDVSALFLFISISLYFSSIDSLIFSSKLPRPTSRPFYCKIVRLSFHSHISFVVLLLLLQFSTILKMCTICLLLHAYILHEIELSTLTVQCLFHAQWPQAIQMNTRNFYLYFVLHRSAPTSNLILPFNFFELYHLIDQMILHILQFLCNLSMDYAYSLVLLICTTFVHSGSEFYFTFNRYYIPSVSCYHFLTAFSYYFFLIHNATCCCILQ